MRRQFFAPLLPLGFIPVSCSWFAFNILLGARGWASNVELVLGGVLVAHGERESRNDNGGRSFHFWRVWNDSFEK